VEVVELPEPPRLPALYARAVAGLLPGRRLTGDRLPETRLVLRRVVADRLRLAEYARVCGFRVSDALPPTYPHVLAFPLALALMTGPGFPFPAAGVVHLANRIELRRPLDAAEPLDLAVHVEALRPHPRGRQVDLVAVASVAGAEVWRGVSSYLHRSRAGAGPSGLRAAPVEPPERPGPPSSPEPPAPPAPAAVWRVGAEVGRAYAAVSGDRNPIHTSTLAARAFGFRGRIAHGMWTKARCLAQLAHRLPPGYAVEVSFQAPVLLPATAGFSASRAGGGWQFALHDSRTGRPHLTGTIEPPPGG
jgi:acyl dehydratase